MKGSENSVFAFSFQFFTRLAAIVENQWRRHYWQHWEAPSG